MSQSDCGIEQVVGAYDLTLGNQMGPYLGVDAASPKVEWKDWHGLQDPLYEGFPAQTSF